MIRGTRHRNSRNLLVTFAVIGAMLATLLVSAGPAAAMYPPPGDTCGTLRTCIAALARYEYSNDDGHKYEKPLGSNCNYFSTQWHAAGATQCSNNWWSEEWCMDFARWVYKEEGASVANLDHTAYSAKNYSTYKTVSSGAKPHVGDLAVWATESHVGIVVSVDSTGRPTVISGNSLNPDRGDYTALWRNDYSVSTFQGFAGPA